MDWWQTFFDDTYLKLYGQTLPPERADWEVKGMLSILDLPAGARILDLCCGQGRHSVRLAQAGYDVTGLDLSPQLLAVARQAAEEAGVKLALVQGDMREIPYQGEFDAIVNMFTAFGYFDSDAENERVWHTAAGALKPGGQFLLDNQNIYAINAVANWRYWMDSDVGIVAQDRTFDPWTGRDATVYYWQENGERKSRSFSVRVYTSYELVAMARRAGLTPVKLLGGLDGSAYHCRDSRRCIILAKKEG